MTRYAIQLVAMKCQSMKILCLLYLSHILVDVVLRVQEWDDVFLQWDPAEYGGLEVLRLPCHKIWLPDIVLYNKYLHSMLLVSVGPK